ncbi:MAG: 3-alpha,7-alpha,12-alpha-trihydroxy-5-beta-cholest-24-enoyl-CoA hydratase [Alphaproteobacteria bacterium]|nr:3-alpha,7-alpha,12-alpha-trihydroxy-5-beta-cholest-24-enoyl-CoA hydratase [Alphaproteobacteria bacterium]
MAIVYENLMALEIPDVVHTYTPCDTILYALALGYGADPTDGDQLRLVYDDGLVACPTLATVLARPVFWMRDLDTGIDYANVVHGEQAVTIHRPLPVAGTVRGRTTIREIIDKGPGKGAFIVNTREVTDAATGVKLATLDQVYVARNDGGFGGPNPPSPRPAPPPERAPDAIVELATLPQAALIYRLSGDMNPLHADPRVAAAAGFPRPILHGLGTFGIAARAVIQALCPDRPDRLVGFSARFSAPVFPGETIATEIWREGDSVRFQSHVAARDTVVMRAGLARLSA